MPTPFRVQVPDDVLQDLGQRLARTRWPDDPPGEQAATGIGSLHLRDLVGHWQDGFDWRSQEAQLNAVAQFTVDIGDQHLHFVHQPGTGRRVVPLLLLHGWPGSVWEFHKLLPLLTNPARFGLADDLAFTVVAPSLPGFAFSHRPGQRRLDRTGMAGLLHTLMVDVLGYGRFAVQGGDLGAHIGTKIAEHHPGCVLGLHLNFLGFLRNLARPERPSEEERSYFHDLDGWLAQESGYQWIQGTKPQTLAYALTDSPAGLCAWMGEKFLSWTDHDGDPAQAVTRDEQLTAVMLYWVNAAVNSSFWLYHTARHGDIYGPEPVRIPVPMAHLSFPKEIMRPPRSVAAAMFDVRRWTLASRGGHFAALEQPQALAADMREFFATL